MWRILSIFLTLALIVALPFALRRPTQSGDWRPGNPLIIIVSPHNEAIRYEFEQAFSKWHQRRFGQAVRIEWRSIGGTTEISRYLTSEFTAAARSWWTRQLNKPWPAGAAEGLTATRPPADAALLELYNAFRSTDDPGKFTSNIDLFFGGGEFDHRRAFQAGLTVDPWPDTGLPDALAKLPDGTVLIPDRISGETWRTRTLFGNTVSAFGICCNLDRLGELNIAARPTAWDDLADPRYFRQVGAADPNKSGSVAKAFEMMIHQKCYQAVRSAGYSDGDIRRYEAEMDAFMKKPGSAPKPGEVPPTVPPEYQRAIERGWEDGVFLVQRIGANARYFTDSASKVPIDVSKGNAAIGMAIDFYARYQAQNSRGPDGQERMIYFTPAGGSSVSCDPISLLRGAGDAKDANRRVVAIRFIEFVLSEEGQRIWTYRPGTPGGPEKHALRRLPIRRDFYPSTQPAIQARHENHRKFAADDLADPQIDPFSLASEFIYHPRWTGNHFNVHRELIKVMCIDAGDELREAWSAIIRNGGPGRLPEAMAALRCLPEVTLPLKSAPAKNETVCLNWRTAPDFYNRFDSLDYQREWAAMFRKHYKEARQLAEAGR